MLIGREGIPGQSGGPSIGLPALAKRKEGAGGAPLLPGYRPPLNAMDPEEAVALDEERPEDRAVGERHAARGAAGGYGSSTWTTVSSPRSSSALRCWRDAHLIREKT
jgi:hypothetical protein